MMVITILSYIFLGLITILMLFLIVPVEYFIQGEKYDNAFIRIRVLLFKGAFGFHLYKTLVDKAQMSISIFGYKVSVKSNKLDKKAKNSGNKNKGESFRGFLDSRFLKILIESLKKTFIHIKPKHFILEGRAGFEDPYYTGMLCAVLNIFYSELHDACINVEPVFDDEILEGRGLIQGRVVPAYMAYIALKLYLSRPVRIKIKTKEVKSYGNGF